MKTAQEQAASSYIQPRGSYIALYREGKLEGYFLRSTVVALEPAWGSSCPDPKTCVVTIGFGRDRRRNILHMAIHEALQVLNG